MKELSSEKTITLLAYGKERAAIPKFFELAAEHFDIEQIPDSTLEPCHEATTWSTHTIGIAKMKLIQKTN